MTQAASSAHAPSGHRGDADHGDIAIVGMAARLPGSATLDAYWYNLAHGVRSIRRLSDAELAASGEAPHLLKRPDYVPYAAPLEDFAHFDAEFFGLSPKDAAIMDPQHRQFLECAWEAMESAGHVPAQGGTGFAGPIGVFAGSGVGSYYHVNIMSNADLVAQTGTFLLRHTGNDKDFLSTRLSHIFDLRGPSLNIQTACSTSLVATHTAAQSLLAGECDMALAGGVTIELPHARGYVFKEGEILSPDGECHAFDHRAQGTVFGSGVGVVVLRRLADAVADGDHIWAVIKGSAVNNDGADKAGYLAPSVGGQAAAIAQAQAVAGITADTVDYVECHGTGTYLGDPIEVAALTEAFARTSAAVDHCRIGSVKTNIGHLDTAAGAASLIKASLALHHGQMPPSLGYEAPNPAIPFDGSPFRVNDTLTPWPARDHPPRAGVNSLGVGGTNAHVVLQKAPVRAPSEPSDWPFQLYTLSARSKAALEGTATTLAAHLAATDQPAADIAWTLRNGRRHFERRRVVVADSAAEAARLLTENDPRRVFTHTAMDAPKPTFMFPGGGAQYAGMARDLYETEPVFADWMDRGLGVLAPMLDYDIRALWLPERGQEAAADAALQKPSVQLPLIMITEYALAQLWMAWGVTPDALIGHSMGENTAAAVAGVMTFEDCIGLVHLRGTLFDSVAAGGMLSVALSADDLRPWLGDALDLAGINAPQLSVATGPQGALDDLAVRLKAADIDCQRIAIDIAAHSRMLEPILEPFGAYLRSIPLSAPQIPFVSNRTGTWITDAQATDPDYWVAHLRGTVNFEGGLTTLAADPRRLYVEVGPGKALGSLAGQHASLTPNQIIGTLRHPKDTVADDAYFVAQLGRVWAAGGTFDWGQIWGDARRNRVPLPTYAFQRSEYFIAAKAPEARADTWLMRDEDREDWAWRPVWRPAYAVCDVDTAGDLADAPRETWLMFACDTGVTDAAAARLRGAGHDVITVRPGDGYARTAPDAFRVAPEKGRESYDRLLRALSDEGRLPARIVHGWLLTADETHRPGSSFFHRTQEHGFWSLFHLAQAWGGEAAGEAAPHIVVLTSGAMQVRAEALPYPEKATVMGPAQVIPREFPGMTVAVLDLALPKGRAKGTQTQTAQLLEELLAEPANGVAALREGKRFAAGVRRGALPQEALGLAPGSTVLLTGGFGGIGLTVADTLVRTKGARIALVARSPLPPREDWDTELARTAPGSALHRRIEAVRALEDAGGTVLTLAADVSNIEEMRAAVAEIEATLGPVRAVVHAAGVIDDAPILAKSSASIEDVFTPKIHGTQVLDRLFPDGTLDWMALFSSTSTVTAPAGQVDYVAANAYLNAFAKARAGGKTRYVAINWGLWADVGMAADAMAARTGREAAPEVAIEALLLDTAGFDGSGARRFAATYQADRWFVDEHRTKAGDALVPGTGYLELAAEALAAQGEAMPFAIEDLHFLRPLRVDEAGVGVTVTLPRSDEGYGLRIESAAPGAAPEVNAEGTLSLLPLARPAPLDVGGIAARCGPAEEGDLRSPQEAHLAFGPRWAVLRERRFGAGEGLARLALPPAARGDTAILHPALMDIATGWAMPLIDGYDGARLWVPVSYGAVRVHAPLGREVLSHVRNADANTTRKATASFDITLAAPDGTVLVEIEDFTIRQMEGDVRFAAPKRAEVTGPRPLSPAEERLRHNLTQGIPAADGAALFLRAMAASGPGGQVILTSLPLDALIAQAEAEETRAEVQTFERPQLDSDYVAPEGEIERRLAGFWQELLGVADVGAEDSFFDLGGHSLIAVRLFAMVKKAFAVDFPISILFEAPTIRACAALIAARGVVVDEGAPDAPKAAAARRFTHLVPMHEGEGGAKTPFFLVAGMFGNVLNLRHLAHLLGTDRPFFGLQARGLYGDAAPHDDLVAAARDMIVEMRAVQPEGPYMVGGFSGGGITAYEIAQQLTQAGEEVAALVMLDTPLPQRRPLTKADRMAIQRQELRAGGIAYPFRWLANRLRWEIAKRRPRDAAADGAADEGAFHDTAIEAAFYAAIARYDVRPWHGPLTLFRPPQVGKWEVAPGRWVSSERAYVLPDNDWTAAAPAIEVIEVPGDHDSMVLEPNVRVLAARMKKGIEAAERAARRRASQAAAQGAPGVAEAASAQALDALASDKAAQ